MSDPDHPARRDAVRSGPVLPGALLLLGAGWFRWHLATAQLRLEFVVPDDYTGLLVALGVPWRQRTVA